MLNNICHRNQTKKELMLLMINPNSCQGAHINWIILPAAAIKSQRESHTVKKIIVWSKREKLVMPDITVWQLHYFSLSLLRLKWSVSRWGPEIYHPELNHEMLNKNWIIKFPSFYPRVVLKKKGEKMLINQYMIFSCLRLAFALVLLSCPRCNVSSKK